MDKLVSDGGTGFSKAGAARCLSVVFLRNVWLVRGQGSGVRERKFFLSDGGEGGGGHVTFSSMIDSSAAVMKFGM